MHVFAGAKTAGLRMAACGVVHSGYAGRGTPGECSEPGARRCHPNDWPSTLTIQNPGADLEDPVCAARRPVHLPPLVHSGNDHLVHETLRGRH